MLNHKNFIFLQIDSDDSFRLTLDTHPNANNYRNLLSITGAVNTRPTLSELQVKLKFLKKF